MRKIIAQLIKKAKQCPALIVFPEADEPRILQAAVKCAQLGIAKPILLGNIEKTTNNLKKLKLSTKNIAIIDQLQSPSLKKYAQRMYQLRKTKGWTYPECEQKVRERIYFATMMVEQGDAQGLISGSSHTKGYSIRPALQLIKKQQGWIKKEKHDVSAVHILLDKYHHQQLLFFADVAITIDPTPEELAEIGIDTGLFAKKFKLKPKIAFLSFSTKGSAEHPFIDKVRKAVALAQAINKKRKLGMIIDGELQLDAAIDKRVNQIKCKGKCSIKGDANVLIFPDLQSANIGYKLTQRLARDDAIGPITQGLSKPVNDLSRGCSVEEIVTLAAITSLEAAKRSFI